MGSEMCIRASLPAMVALGVGGYVVKKVIDKKQTGDDTTTPPHTSTAPAGTAKAKAA